MWQKISQAPPLHCLYRNQALRLTIFCPTMAVSLSQKVRLALVATFLVCTGLYISEKAITNVTLYSAGPHMLKEDISKHCMCDKEILLSRFCSPVPFFSLHPQQFVTAMYSVPSAFSADSNCGPVQQENFAALGLPAAEQRTCLFLVGLVGFVALYELPFLEKKKKWAFSHLPNSDVSWSQCQGLDKYGSNHLTHEIWTPFTFIGERRTWVSNQGF